MSPIEEIPAAPSGPIKAIVSDFAGVLTTPIQAAFVAVQERVNIPAAALADAMVTVTEQDGLHPLYELECGRMTEDRFMTRLAEVLSEQLGRPVPMHTFTDEYFRHLHTNHEMVGMIESLGARGYRTALLTNNVREWEPRWRAMLPVDELFELVVDSAYVGLRKPDPAIYALTCERLALPPEACMLIDDFAHNCEAARQTGMRAVWFEHTAQAIADVERELQAPSVV